jgi:hypothetical protein
MKKQPEKPPGFDKFDELFRAVIAVPKSEVEKEDARERVSNQRKRAKSKAAKKTNTPRSKPHAKSVSS